MFRWFNLATKCYVYLSDVRVRDPEAEDTASDFAWRSCFLQARWFTRAWTLQELLAPRHVEFFSVGGTRLGDRSSLEHEIQLVTQLPTDALRGASLSNFSVDERLAWVADRQATRQEDMAYALLGMFGVFMPILYGEGQESAFKRLRRAIEDSMGTFAQDKKFQARDPLQYRALRNSEIRVLILYPRELSEELWAHLVTLDIIDEVPANLGYQALSYVWGHKPALHSLRMNETEKIAIKPNLLHALQRIRLHSQCVRLWIDSICINQSDEEERNSQVQRMGDIFQKAQNVWIWLGEKHSNSDDAMELIPRVSRADFQWQEAWAHQNEFQALNNLLGRPWFQRGWVIQEAAFSKHSIVFCGGRQVDWKDFTKSVVLIQDRFNIHLANAGSSVFGARLRLLFSNFRESPATRLLDLVTNMDQIRMGREAVKLLSLETLVEMGTHFETTDPRDTIYALINLANDVSLGAQPSIPGSIEADYRKSMVDVFADFIVHCCRVSGSLDVICRPWAPQGVFQGDQMLQEDLPSWIRTCDQLPFGDPSKRYSYRLHSNSLVED